MKRILLIEDQEGVRLVWKRFHDLAEPVFRGQLELQVANDLEQGRAKLKGDEYDAIILDLTLPPLASDEVITFIAEQHHALPPIYVLTGDDDIYVRRRCMMSGASGFWLKADAEERPDLFFKSLYNAYLKRHAERTRAS